MITLIMDDERERVYGPKDWKELTGAPLPTLPANSVMCGAIKDDGNPCGNRAVGGTPLCRAHGGTTIAVQEQARRRIDAVRSELFDVLCDAAKEATDTYVQIMRTGKKDADRLKAADRVLELLGFRDSVSNVPAHGPEESDIDKQLKVLLVQVADDRLKMAIEATVHEATDVDDNAA